MYKIYLDNTIFCDPRAEELAIIEPVVRLERNQPGEFTFTIPPTHERRGDIHERTSIFDVYSDNELIFSGACMSLDTDFYNQIVVTCEGELGYFNDSIQRPARYQGLSVRQLLETYVANHNAQVDEFKRFEVGAVTVTDPNDYIYCYTNNNSTMTELKEDLVDDLGGYFHIRHENGVRYLDYLADDLGKCEQEIRLGENLLDYDSNLDLTNLATVIIPLGAKLEESAVEGLDTRLTIESVNDGKDYIEGEAVKTYGRINQTVIFDNVTTATMLLSKGKKYLEDTQFAELTLTVKAIDLYWIDGSERFQLNKSVHVVSKAHGMDKYMPITTQTLNLWNPEKDELTLGVEERKSLSTRMANMYDDILAAIESITPQSTILEAAKKNATALITSANGGYVYKTRNELYIMDTDDPDTAQRVWRWNINGLGYSKTGVNGEYGLAMTMDGAIVADFITAGVLKGVRVQTTDNKVYLTDKEGIIANKGIIGAWHISEDTATEGALYSDNTINGARYRVWMNQPQSASDTWIFSIQKEASSGTFSQIFNAQQNGNVAATGNLTMGGSISSGGKITANGNITANGDIQATNANMYCNNLNATVGVNTETLTATSVNSTTVTANKVYADNDGSGQRQCATSTSNGTVFAPDSTGVGVWIGGTYAGRINYS